MEERIEYQVLAPDSVAWFIQAALVADRKGNVHTRDLALAEAQRIAAERRLVEGPAPDGSRVPAYDVAHECNGVRLATIERRQEEDAATFGEHVRRILALETAMRGEHRTMHATFNEHQARLDALAARLEKLEIDTVADRNIMHAMANRLDALEYTMRNLQRLAQGVHGPEAGL